MKAGTSSTEGSRSRATVTRRRRWTAAVVGLSMATLTACGSSGSSGSGSSSGSSGSGSSSGSSSSGSAKGSPYSIHAILSLSGNAAFLGNDEKRALTALQNQVNSSGGIDGHPLKFAIQDDQSTASVAVSLASRLISSVPMLIIGSITTVDRPVDALVSSNGPVIYDLSPGDHPKRGSFVFSSGNATTNLAAAFANFAVTKGWTHIAAITSTDASGQDGWKSVQKAVANSNGKISVTDHETFAPTAVSVTTQLNKIKATNPQAVIVWTTGTPFSTVVKGMQQVGLSLPTMTTNGNESYKELTGLSSELPSQLYFASARFHVPPAQLTGQAKTSVQNFLSAIKTTGQPVPDEGNALAWDPGLIFVSALKKLGTGADAAKIHSYITSLKDFPGVSGTYNFTNPAVPDNRGVDINSVYVTEWSKSAKNWTPMSGPAGKAK